MAPQHQENKGTKRKQRYSPHSNPRRGAPGILLTCESFREVKCRREGLEILKYYWEHFHPSEKQKEVEEKQSLEEELSALKRGTIREKCPFVSFDTGCQGTVWYLLDPKEHAEKEGEPDSFQETKESEATETLVKKQRRETTTAKDENLLCFNPVEMVTQILRDVKDKTSKRKGLGIPGSRFVTRIIPLQATCSVSIEDIQATTRTVTAAFIHVMSEEERKTVRTFAVQIKRRNCGHVKRLDMIVAVADQVAKTVNELLGKEWSVDLTTPDVTVWLEVCKSICGISLFSKETLELSPNWNVAEIRDNDDQSDPKADE